VASYTTKPADLESLERVFAEVTMQLTPPIRALLLIESDPAKRAAITEVLTSPERMLDTVSNAAEALEALRTRAYQGVVIDVDLPDEDGLELLRQIRSDPAIAPIPAVLYSQHALDPEAVARVHQLDAAIGEGEDALAVVGAEVARFLMQVQVALPAGPAPSRSQGPEVVPAALRGKCVLVVDDDARNLFALTGLLESYGMKVIAVDNGHDALRKLETRPDVDIVLMDIMMPDLDGYDTISRIRAVPRVARLPIIALTAKAMLEDRNKCITAGASDYASKPVDTEQLLSQLSVWLAA
jgi:CheY-like chemotaxis protein